MQGGEETSGRETRSDVDMSIGSVQSQGSTETLHCLYGGKSETV